MVKNQYFIDPVIIDLATGEMILTATYPNNIIKEENAGAITSACFSADNKSYFYTIIGRFGDNRVRLCRYNLGTGNTETLFETEDWACRPHLSQLANGSFMLISDGTKESALACFENKNGEWSLKRMVPFVNTKAMYHLTDVRYSANSGYAILSGGISTGYFYAFQMLKPDEDFSGFDQYLSLSVDTNEIVKTTAEEYEQTIKDHMRTPEEGETQLIHTDLDYPYQLILNIILSPDGHYAMLNTSAQSMDGNSRNLFLVRLDDLAVRKISGLDASDIQVGAMAGTYQIMIEWNTDDLIIGTKSGIKTYRFDY